MCSFRAMLKTLFSEVLIVSILLRTPGQPWHFHAHYACVSTESGRTLDIGICSETHTHVQPSEPWIWIDWQPLWRSLDQLAPGHLPTHHVQMVLFISTGGSAGVTYAALENRFSLSNASASRSVNA